MKNNVRAPVCALGKLCLVALLSAAALGKPDSGSELARSLWLSNRREPRFEKESEGDAHHASTQIEIVEAVGLQPEVLTFFRSIPISIDPSLTGMNGQYSQVDGKWLIRARAGQWPSDRAILLHELLHAYHHQVLKQPTPPIGRAFNEARREGIYPSEYRMRISSLTRRSTCGDCRDLSRRPFISSALQLRKSAEGAT